MCLRYNENHAPLLKVVYSQVKVNGKTELVPLELYADGSLKRGKSWVETRHEYSSPDDRRLPQGYFSQVNN